MLRIDFDRLRREGFSQTVPTALETVTKRYGESYEDLVHRSGANPIGARDMERNEKYRRAIAALS